VGAGVPPHAHDGCVECFYVLAGQYRLTVSGTTHEASPGGFVVVPRGAPHQFEVVGADEARAIVIFTPAGFEEAFRRMPEIFGTPGEPGPLWESVNRSLDTRLLGPADRQGAQAITAAPAQLAVDAASLTTLGTPEMTRTPLAISLNSGLRGSRWHIDPAVAALWVVAGGYRIDLDEGSVIASEGELVSFATSAGVTGTALAPTNQALVLTW